MTEITAEAQKALDRAMKVLEMARRKQGNEVEAEAAAAKFQELLVKYNLDAAQVEAAGGKASGKREEKKVRGGFYKHQAELWGWAAEINFCLHWCVSYWEKTPVTRTRADGSTFSYNEYKRQKRHEIVGRTHNVAATIALAEYLEEAIERAHDRAASEDPPRPKAVPCSMGVGCDEAGVCYATAHGRPEMCPRKEIEDE